MLATVSDWMEKVSTEQHIWYVKRLSGNDTLANESHQAGPYIPKELIFTAFPSMQADTSENQERWFELYLDSHNLEYKVRAIWYNNKFREGTRDEARVTNFGGINSPLLNPENTGAIAIFAFNIEPDGELIHCRCWVADGEKQEDEIEGRIGEIEPGQTTIFSLNRGLTKKSQKREQKLCTLKQNEIPTEWLTQFPSGQQIIEKAIEIRPALKHPPDKRILERRSCEFKLFKSIEEAIELPHILEGFNDLDEFIKKAQSILQRRKSRSGRSLELHLHKIFLEEGLAENTYFTHQPTTEGKKKPDFIFPSIELYHNQAFPESQLRMLAVKTTCKDRWRQILNEANRIKKKHLLTLQEGISINQFNEIREEGVQLVVPEPLINSYAKEIKPHLQTLESFIDEVKVLL